MLRLLCCVLIAVWSILLSAAPAADAADAIPSLQHRSQCWPDWHLPAPLKPAGTGDLEYPSWFAGSWQVSSSDPEQPQSDLHYPVRFAAPAGGGAVVGDRAFNAHAVGRALLGEALLSVANDPANPNRQLARLQGDGLLESTVVARRIQNESDQLWSDELALQIVHRSGGDPRVSQVETLSRYQRRSDGSISGEQWQATYPSPASGLRAAPLRTAHWQLRLQPDAQESDPAS